jgi:hypothetical protein
MNIPARYLTGYLGGIGVPPVPYPMDFSGWFEAYLGIAGIRLMHVIIRLGSAAFPSPTAAMPLMSQSVRP